MPEYAKPTHMSSRCAVHQNIIPAATKRPAQQHSPFTNDQQGVAAGAVDSSARAIATNTGMTLLIMFNPPFPASSHC
jgi:hypothetical protein